MTPNGWQRYKIGGLLANDTPGYWGAPSSGSGDIAVLRSTNLRDNEKLDFGAIAIRSFSDKKIIQKRLEPGDVLLERSGGGPSKPVGRVAYFQANGTYSCSNFMQRLRPNLERVGGKFLAYELSYLHASSVTFRMQQATTGIRNLNYAEYLAYELAVPPLSEQRKIAAILSSVDDAIEKTQAVIDQVRVVKRGLLQELLTRGWPEEHTRFKKTPIGEIPENWHYAPLGTRTELQPGFAFKSQDFSPDGDRLLRGSNVAVGRLTWPADKTKYFPRERRGEVSEYVLQQDDIIVAMDRPFIAGGFKIARVTSSDLPALLLQRVGRFHKHRELTPGYLWQLLQSHCVETHLQITQKGTDLPHISKSEIEASICPFPPVEEQEQIASCLATLDEYATRLSEQQQQAQQLKSALMSVLLTGELRVTPGPEPE